MIGDTEDISLAVIIVCWSVDDSVMLVRAALVVLSGTLATFSVRH